MKYKSIVEGRFLERPNRFIAKVEINGRVETVHVKNTGRCKELLQPGTKVFLEKALIRTVLRLMIWWLYKRESV